MNLNLDVFFPFNHFFILKGKRNDSENEMLTRNYENLRIKND